MYLGQRSALIWGAQRDLKAVQSFREHVIARYIERRWELDAFEMTQASMAGFTRQLEALQPAMIIGYANALLEYARYLNEHEPNHRIRLKGIISSAEKLSEETREIVQQAFRCKVLNRYGSREVGLIASECDRQEGLHVNADNPRGLDPTELYEMRRDPGETRSLAEGERGILSVARQRLEQAADEASEGAVSGESVGLDGAAVERLRSLGYME